MRIRRKAHIFQAAAILALLSWGEMGAFGQALGVPVRLQVEANTREVESGGRVVLKVTLKNFKNEDVPALQDVPVTMSSDVLGKKVDVVVPKGQTSGQVELLAPKAGLAKVSVTSPSLAPGALLLVVRPPAKGIQRLTGLVAGQSVRVIAGISRSPASAQATAEPSAPARAAQEVGRSLPAAAAPASAGARAASTAIAIKPEGRSVRMAAKVPTPQEAVTESMQAATPNLTSPTGTSASPTTGPTASKIEIEVVPVDVYPNAGIWTAEVTVVAMTSSRELALASDDIPVQLVSNLGKLSASQTLIPRGSISTAAQAIKLISDRSGNDILRALSSLGRDEKRVAYNMQVPSQLRLEANPHSVVNDGRSWVNLSVLLLDPDNRPTSYSDRDIDVTLSSSLGELDRHHISIPRGTYWADAKLTSTRHGEAVISAKATELRDAAPVTVWFLFPWLMVFLSLIGGVLGGIARTAKALFSDRWWANLWRNLVVAAIFGLIFYGLAYFGATSAIPKIKIPVAVSNVPTANEFGALVFGFVGGFFGRHIWKA
jgi:hypothetical protein